MKFLAGLLAFISSLYTGDSQYNNSKVPLNIAIISYSETYFAPVVVEPGNFPRAKTVTLIKQSEDIVTPVAPKIVLESTLQTRSEGAVGTPIPPKVGVGTVPATVLPPQPPPLPTPVLLPTTAGDPYLANPEPIVDWYMPTTFRRDSTNNSALPEMIFSREFWRLEVLAYWAPGALSKTSVEEDYFKLEVYEKTTDKLIYTMTSGTEETIHKFQAFKKPGTYYFKTYLKNPSQFEITFTFH